jgi:precorrin-6A synthase
MPHAADPLAAAREAIIARHVPCRPPVFFVSDPERDRSDHDGDTYLRAVADWHAARVMAYSDALRRMSAEGIAGDVGILVWGDPAFYDSTLRIVGQLGCEVDVVPGVSSRSA